MQVFHLSHIDLDGYGSQFVAKHFFENISFFNANYGTEIQARLEKILSLIQAQDKEEEILLLITDLNLSLNESSFLQECVKELKLNGYKIEIMLLDHHISGSESAQKFSWYHLDIHQSACKITFDTLSKRFSPRSDVAWLHDFSRMVDSIDTWKTNGYGFEFGKVAMGMIAQLKDPNRIMFEEENRNIKFFMLDKIQNYLYEKEAEVKFDNHLFMLKKLAFGGDPQKQTMGNICAEFLVSLMEKKKDEMSVFYQNKKGLLTCALGNVSIIGNQFLTQNPDFSFMIDVNMRGNVSLRANDQMDVSLLARELFSGGGHKNASGGRIDRFKESFFYAPIKRQIQDILQEEAR